MSSRPKRNFHVVTILEHRPSGDPAGAATELKLLSRSGSVFWVTVPGRLDTKSLLEIAVLETVGECPARIEFHPKDVRSRSNEVVREVVAYRQE